jgi:ribonuclease HI
MIDQTSSAMGHLSYPVRLICSPSKQRAINNLNLQVPLSLYGAPVTRTSIVSKAPLPFQRDMGFPDSPVELPDGALVCEDHGLQICYQCCCDYTPLNDHLHQSERGGESFGPSEDYPDEILRMAEPTAKVLQGAAARSIANIQASKYCNDCHVTWMTTTPPGSEESWGAECPHHDSLDGEHVDKRTLIVHVDGACPGNGTENAVGGVCIYFGPSSPYNLSAPVSKTARTSTSQQAELRAALYALKIIHDDCIPARRLLMEKAVRCIYCHTKCWAAGIPFQVVIVTDSAYLFECMTSHLLIWRWDPDTRTYSNKKSGNIIVNSEHVRNIVEEVEKLAERGVQVLWKKVPRGLNKNADRLAKVGAQMSSTSSVVS